MASSFLLDKSVIKDNIAALQSFLSKNNLEAFYISSFDTYLNEYVPMEDCHRFYFTGFSGSVANVLVPKEGRIKLYVDGRYHEQADLEVDATLVEVVKLVSSQDLENGILEDIKKLKIKSIGIEGDRTSLSFYQSLNLLTTITAFNHSELSTFIEFKKMSKLKEIQFVAREFRGRDTSEKLAQIFKNENQAFYITAIDSLAWITNCRGYHLPHMSSFLGRGLAVFNKVFVFISKETPVDSLCNNDNVEFIQIDHSEIENKIRELIKNYKIDEVQYDPKMLNSADFLMLNKVFPKEILKEKQKGLVEFHCIKDEEELTSMTNSFIRGDKAIYNTIKWVKESVAKNEKISELDLYHQTSIQYKAQGAVEQSFNTISGVGANGSIIHYGSPKSDIFIKESDMVLLDSGGYFEGGFATDTTRTFMASSITPDPGYKKIYTLVLKGVLQCQNAVFPEGTMGASLDGITRKPLFDLGYNYAHGTGHGVGIHVHEDGVRISPVSDIKMKAGQVVSIEPGIYISGFAGVRIENIAYVEKHPKYEGFLRFRPLVYIGYEPTLIDSELLTKDEKVWLEEYEAECVKRGTSFR